MDPQARADATPEAAEGPRVHQAGPYEAADSSAGMRQAGAT